MGNLRGFIEINRMNAGYRQIYERIKDYSEVEQTLNEDDRKAQASRCMDCGIPFCQWGCTTINIMPEWQDELYKGNWQEANRILQATNNFPEFTGRVCPALCENACTLNLNSDPVTIRENECAVTEKAFALGLVKPQPPKYRTGKKVAVIGSGPAGLACADLLNKWGHRVTIYEKNDAVGGLLRFGIPDFKLCKSIIDRRLQILMAEGLEIKTNCHIGSDIQIGKIMSQYDAVCFAIGAGVPRDLPIPGRDLKGIHFAMDFLTQQNRVVAGKHIKAKDRISAGGKNVLVIGGGDTGSDCVGTSIRQGAKSVTQIEILPKPPKERALDNPWPYWAKILRTSSSHEEGCERYWNINTKRFLGDEKRRVKQTEIIDVSRENNNQTMKEQKQSKRLINTELVLLAMGFLHCDHDDLVHNLGLRTDKRGNITTNTNNQTEIKKIFAAGDAITGASLVVNAIASGRKTAENIHTFLTQG